MDTPFPKKGMTAVCPIEFLPYAIEDPENFALEYLSFPTGATSPFFRDIDKIIEAIHPELPNPIQWDTYSLDSQWKIDNDDPRYIHIDLSIRGDGLGIAMCHVAGWKEAFKRNAKGQGENTRLPIIQWDLVARLAPREAYDEQEINYDAILELLFEIENRGANLREGLTTLDRFQSHQIRTTLLQHGWPCGIQSIDQSTQKIIVDYSKSDFVRKETIPRTLCAAMAALRETFYQERAIVPFLPECPWTPGQTWLEKEAREAQRDVNNSRGLVKVVKGNTQKSTDDLLQAMAGSCHNCMCNAMDALGIGDGIEHSSAKDFAEEKFYQQFEGRDKKEDWIQKEQRSPFLSYREKENQEYETDQFYQS